jgi:hypothetical protein
LSPEAVSRLLQVAVRHLGKIVLATKLNVTPDLIDRWINRHATMPDRKVLALIDLLDQLGVLDDQPPG